ncbi:O-antigen biosynthesis glycosyltransferase WbnK [termite gut metagenome]|uniref:O-antigen biosynthesis glycosyltransferase WbnK n=1 Tax=termite gut metagenome TaxID=433724 RepID=A0A5J4SIP6_9ZZZZ
MIIIKLSSGLGNQLFMYAFSKLLESQLKISPCFDDSYYKADPSRHSELNILYPNYPTAQIKLNPVGKRNVIRFFCKFYHKCRRTYKIINEKDEFNIKLLYSQKTYYFNGYWQHEKYYNFFKADWFVPKETLPTILGEIKEKILNAPNPVAIHIRRGDYFNNQYMKQFGICTEVYFKNAMSCMEEMEQSIEYFVFSDDIQWVRTHLTFHRQFYMIENHQVNSFWYIYLMSLCRHNIISNSTFSWWGAYLNSNPQKEVFYPSKWVKDESYTLAMNSWIKIKVD